MVQKVLLITVTILALWSSTVLANGANGECQSICPLAYQPQCATNEAGSMHTFQNDCSRIQENCQQKTNYQKTSDGPCP